MVDVLIIHVPLRSHTIDVPRAKMVFLEILLFLKFCVWIKKLKL